MNEEARTADQSLIGMPEHVLARVAEEPSECDRLFWNEAERAGGEGDCRYDRPEALASKLAFCGYELAPALLERRTRVRL